jgi:hypothetical protein
MKANHSMQQWMPKALVGLALAVSTSLGLAADITYNFDTSAQGWYAADSHGSVVWDNTHGRGGNGCLKCTIVGGTDTEVDPRVDVAYNTLGYFSVEYDLMIDPDSGSDAAMLYGNLQMVDWDAGWNWHSEWYGSLGGPGASPFQGTWKHVTQVFTATYGARVRLAFQIAASSAPYNTNAIFYIDNIVIRDGTPPNKAVLYDFAWPEQCKPDNTWGGGGASTPVFSQDTTLATNGCLKQVVTYASGVSGWQDAPAELHGPAFNPTKYTYLDFDLYLDAPTGLPTYGGYALAYWWSWAQFANANLSAANIGKWTHYSFPIPSGAANGIVLHPGGNNLSGTFTYYLDNVTLWSPATPPAIKSMVKASGAGGVQVTMYDNSSQYEREGITTPSGYGPYSWAVQGSYPVSYSFTITNFPAAATHAGLEAHMYLVNGDTDGTQPTWNSTYGGMDWNVPDILKFTVENDAAGGAIARIDWKTNLPGANPLTNAIYHPVYAQGSNVVGTWTLTFTDATHGSVTGPGLVATNFTMPAEAVTSNFSPVTDYLHFGIFKNDGANNGRNNQASGTFGAVEVSVGGNPVLTDTFPGPGLTANYSWRKSTSSGGGTAVQWTPPGIAYWLSWGLPDDGFEAYVTGAVKGPWVDAGVGAANGYFYTSGATRIGGVPAANMPSNATNSAFFQLRK